MYGIVMHDYMRDCLSKEFVIVYGKTKEEAITNAWNSLKVYMEDEIKELQSDNDGKVTKKIFSKIIIDNEKSDDSVYFSSPYELYVKLFEIPG